MALRKSIANPSGAAPTRTDWRGGLPKVSDGHIVLRQLRVDDTPSLVAHLSDARVSRYIAPCPSTAARCAQFVRWTHAERRRGKLACFGIVPAGGTSAVGVIQVWPVERDFSTAEWGFALGASYWGTGLFVRAARLVLDAVFSELGVYRLEARVVDMNKRGNGVLQKLGATRDGVLRGGFHDGVAIRDHVMWSTLAPAWQVQKLRTAPDGWR